SLEAGSGSVVPPVYITKYNRFVDNIMERINRILRKNYDPVNVRLHNNNNNNSNNNNNNNNNKKKNKNRKRRPGGSRKGSRRPGHRSQDYSIARSTTEAVEATMNESLAAISAQLIEEHPNVELIHDRNSTNIASSSNIATTTELATTKRSSNDGMLSRARPQHHQHRNKNSNKKTKKNKNRGRQRPSARATLYGLSSLRREGDVTVNMMSSHTTVKTKFTVGPLILKVEKEFGRGAKKDIRSATATTTEMTGKLNLRVLHGGAATLHSIRVMQPKQVRVESSDDHDKTREYVWKRSSHIAHVVSQKLTNATKSMLQPPPIPHNAVLA
ncbi:hypothetical protein ANN_21403, partial [Periplaneta americana]